ncbi:MAG: M56 family metallopeptidase [Bacteroidota bacterium]
MIEYLIESSLCLGMLYVMHQWLLHKTHAHRANRFVLLASVLLGLLIPVIHIPMPHAPDSPLMEAVQPLVIEQYLPMGSPAQISVQENVSLETVLLIFYGLICLLLSIRFLVHLSLLLLKANQAKKVPHGQHTLYLLPDIQGPFTFFRFIFVNEKDFKNRSLPPELLLHEQAHRRQLHSIDNLLMNLIQIFCWYQPFVHLFHKRIKENHEYLADAAVIQTGHSPHTYAHLLLQHSIPQKMMPLGSGFSQSLIKNRIMKLSASPQKKTDFRFACLLPVLALLMTTAFTNPTRLTDLVREEGTASADYIVWSQEDKRVFFIGETIRIDFGENHINGSGRFSFLGQVDVLFIDGEGASMDERLSLPNGKCRITQLSPAESRAKYGVQRDKVVVEVESIR